MKIHSVGADFFSIRRGGRTDRHKKLIVGVGNFANAPKAVILFWFLLWLWLS